MKNIFLIVTIFVVALSVQAESLKPLELPDQFDTKTALNLDTQWLIFSSDKDISDKVNKAFDDLKVTDINSLKGIYVADISKMPSIVSSMFAIPKMKKYNFKVVLDQDGAPTKALPREEKKATLIKLNKLEIVETKFTDSVEEIKKFVQAQLPVQK
jgi:hypothetical protein